MVRPIILRLEHITKQFSQATTPAVEAVTLNLCQGEILGLLGPSGCGKTTLLRLIAGFEQPQAGTIEVAGQVVAKSGNRTPPEQRSVGMVFQDFALFPHLRVDQNIAFGLQKLHSSLIKERTAELFALVGLQDLATRYPHELSGGQQQRVALARALAPQPALVLLDEPLSNLDKQVRLYLREEVRKILKTTGISGVFVTHDQEDALAVSDYVAIMQLGRLMQVGTPEEIYKSPASRFVAEFVTQANFLPTQRKGQLWETEVGCFALPPDPGFALTQLNAGELMIRQEDLILEPDANGTVMIRNRHFLGREYDYCLLTASGRELHARTSIATDLAVGTRVELSVAEHSLRVFPTSSGVHSAIA